MNKSCWSMVNNLLLTKLIYFKIYNIHVFKFDKCMKNKYNKILYISICNLIFNTVDHVLTKCWTLSTKCRFFFSKVLFIDSIFQISIKYLNQYVPWILSEFSFLDLKIMNCQKFHFFEENFFSYMSLNSPNLFLFEFFCYENICTDY